MKVGKLNKFMKKVMSSSLALLMTFTTVSTNIVPVNAASNSYYQTEASVNVLSSGLNIPSLGHTTPVYEIKLDGYTAFCLEIGERMSSGTLLARENISNTVISGTRINSIFNWYKGKELIFGANTELSQMYYVMAQVIMWGNSNSISEDKIADGINDVVHQVFPGIPWNPDKAQDQITEAYGTTSSGNLYIYDSGISSYQLLLTNNKGDIVEPVVRSTKSTKSYTSEENIKVQINKTDVDSKRSLSGVKFDFYQDNKKGGSDTTDSKGKASHTFTRSVTKSATSGNKQYFDGYSGWSKYIQDAMKDEYPNAYTSYSSAKSAADKEALNKAKALAEAGSGENHTYKVVETATKTGYYLNPDNDTWQKDLKGGGTVTFNLSNKRQTGSIDIVKRDSKTGNGVKGAVYGLYAAENISNPDGSGVVHSRDSLAATFPATDSNGRAKLDNLYLGNYYIKEITASDKYIKDPNSYNVSLPYKGSSVTVSTASQGVTEVWQPGTITITKRDDEADNGRTLEGAVFELYARNNIVHPDGHTGVVYSAGQKVGTFPATNNGTTQITGLYLGDYYVREVTAPNNYVLDDSAKNITLSYAGQDAQVSVQTPTYTNHRQEGKITITKHDLETDQTVPGAVYQLYAADTIYYPDGHRVVKYNRGDLVGTFPATATNGQSYLDKLYLGKYYIIEKTAPDGYFLSDQRYDVELTYAGQNVAVTTRSQKVTDKVQRGTISFIKEDRELANGAPDHGDSVWEGDITDADGDRDQGDSTRKGATYGLYAKHDIVHKDTKTGVITYNQTPGSIHEIKLTKGTDLVVKNAPARAGTLLATAKTDGNGEIKFEHLYLGDYYIKEIEPSEGFLLDTTVYNVTINYAGQNVEITNKSTTVYETVMRQAFEMLKVGTNGDSGETEILEGAEFTVKLTSDVKRMGWDAAPTYDVLTTDKKGYALSKELPYGTYTVRETVTPAEHEKLPDFTVIINKDSREPQVWRIFNDAPFEAYVAIVKKDAETGRNVKVPGATFKIKTLDEVKVNGVTFQPGEYLRVWAVGESGVAQWVSEFHTNENGEVMTPFTIPVGSYQLEEFEAPFGYIQGDDPIPFEITNTGIYQDGPDGTAIITVIQENQPVKGQVTVSKVGELLVSAEKDSNGNYTFNYQEGALEGAEFSIYADEDIMAPDGSEVVKYKKDTLVATITSGSDGEAVLDDLYMGKYYVKEVKAPNGFVLNTEIKKFEITYADQNTPIVFRDVDYTDTRQKIDLSGKKLDSDTGVGLKGAEFTVYNKNDILDSRGQVLIPRDTALETAKSNGQGVVNFSADLPLGEYYVKETKAPDGYASTDLVKNLDCTYKGQDVSTIEKEVVYENDITHIEVSKQDENTNVELVGAHFRVFDKNNQIVDEWHSDGTRHSIKGLKVGETYRLVELFAPNGYILSDEVEFTVKDTGDVQHVIMEDKATVGEVTVEKRGEVLVGYEYGNFLYEERSIEGATFEIRAQEDIKHPDGKSEDIYKAGDLVATITTGEDGLAVARNLPLGKYVVTEKTAPDGFVINGTEKYVELVYENDKVAVVYDETSLTNERQKVEVSVSKVDSDTDVGLKGAEFTIYNKEDIVSADGDVILPADSEIETVVTGDDGTAKFTKDFPLGLYYVKETKAPIGYASSDKVVEIDARYQGQSVTIVSGTAGFENDITKIEVSKKGSDLETGLLAGATLAVYPLDVNGDPIKGECFDTWVTTDDVHVIYGLEVGKSYRLVELTPAEGYTTAEPIDFTVGDTGDIQKVEMVDTPTSVDFAKVDPHNNDSYVEGATLAVYPLDENNEPILGECWEMFLTPNGTYNIKHLPIGKYLLREVVTPYAQGYVTADDVIFEVTDTRETQYVEMEDEHTRVDVEKVDKVTGEAIPNTVLALIPYNDEGKLMEGETFITTKTDENGKFHVEYIPVGDYVIREVGTNFDLGYVTANDLTIRVEDTADLQTFTMKDDHTKLEVTKVDKDTKVGIPDTTLSIIPIDDEGNLVEGAKWLTARTDKEGKIKTEYIPVGKYVLREEGTNFGLGYVTADDVVFEVKDTADLQEVVMEDDHTTVKIKKVDAETGNPIRDTILALIPFDDEGNLMEGETFITERTDKDGQFTVEYVPVGKYVVREVGTNYGLGYVTAKDLVVEVKDTEELQTFTMKDDHTRVDFDKTDITTGEPVVGAELKVIPVDDDGNPLEGETFETWVTDGSTHRIEYLPVGDYILRERLQGQAWDYGYVTANDVKFTVEDTGEVQKVEMKDDYTKVEITKTDIVTGAPVKGAELSIIPVKEDGTLDEGAVFDTWITDVDNPETKDVDESVHYIERIPVGKYVLREKLGQAAELGYVTANDVEFEVKDTGEIQKVEMKDDFTNTEFKKVDTEGKAVAGATMSIVPLDEDGNPMYGETFDTWLTQVDDEATKDIDESVHKVEYLPIGKYLLVETSAPDGYVKAKPVEFEVEDTSEVQEFTMVEKRVSFTKEDATGSKEIPGAEIEVIDKDGNIVDKWTSTEDVHYISGLEEGEEYTLREVLAPEGYVTAEEIKFTVTTDKEDQTVKMNDIRLDVSKVDTEGNYIEGAKLQIVSTKTKDIVDQWVTTDETHYTSNLIEGHTYILKEIETPKGYVTASDVEFTVNTDKKDQSIKMIDKQVLVGKVDANGSFVEGAKLQVLDKETEEVLDEWVTGSDKHVISNLVEGKEYILREVETPKGYVTANDVEFTATTEKDNQVITVIDERVSVSKLDVAGEEIEGAELHVEDKDGNIVDKWTSSDEVHYIEGLHVGETYTLVEDLAPIGYVIANEIEFTVTEDGVDTHIDMVDKIVKINKVDEDGNFVKGAKLSVLDSNGKEVDTWVTGEEGHRVSNLVVGNTYTLREVEVPKGYSKANDQTFVVVDDGKDQEYNMVDKLVPVTPKTGDDTNVMLASTALLGSLAGLIALIASKKRKEEKSN